jgi:sec-independent protein translocase protein TatB
MSGVSSAELLLLLVIGLIVLGPKRLPEIANKIGGWVGQARRMTRVMRRQLEDELNIDEIRSIGTPKKVQPQAEPPKPAPAAAPPEVEVVAEHIPRDDDAYSPLHETDKE